MKVHYSVEVSRWRRYIDAGKRMLRSVLNTWMILLVRFFLLVLPESSRNHPVKRSLWAGTPIMTLTLKARAERLLGIEAKSLVYHTYYVTAQFDHDLSKWTRWPVLRNLLPYVVLLWSCIRYQRFHFFYDRGLLPALAPNCFNLKELQLLRQLRKEIYFWAYGADVRTRERTCRLGPYHCCTDCPTPRLSCVCDEEIGKSNYHTVRRHATAVFSMGDMTEYTPGSRNDLFYWPIDLKADGGKRFAPCYPDPEGRGPLRVVHAPNHREFKGTRFLLAAVARLQREGVKIDLQLVEKVPNHEALEIYRSADLIFDQCLIGFHGYFALEAMAMGKPVMTFIRKQSYLLAPEECPFLSVQLHQICEALRNLSTDRHRLYRLGKAGRRYIGTYFSLEAFAARLNSTYQQLRPDSAKRRKKAA